MRRKLLIYAFVFVCLLSLFQYVNSKNIFDTYQEKMTKHIEREEVLKDSIQHLNKQLMDLKNQLETKQDLK